MVREPAIRMGGPKDDRAIFAKLFPNNAVNTFHTPVVCYIGHSTCFKWAYGCRIKDEICASIRCAG
jgi:hypothetical protein